MDTTPMDECDLSEADRSAIEEAERRAQETHWVILGLSGEVTAADVKRAYFEASKRFHPDRYFGKRLGGYSQRLEALFIRVKVAYDVLGNDAKRAEYAKAYPPPTIAETRPAVPVAPPEDPERASRLEDRRRQIAEERKSKLKGQVLGDLRALKLTRLQSSARSQLDAGDLAAAATTIDELLAEAPKIKQIVLLSAELLERQGNSPQALERYRVAQELDANDADVKRAIQRLTGHA